MNKNTEVVGYIDRETFYILSGLGDYIWKMREQLDDLRDKELGKLTGYKGETIRLRRAILSYYHDNLFPNALHYSFVILLLIMVEDRLKEICNHIQQVKNLPLRAKDLRGDTLEQCMTFLEKLAGVPRTTLPHWPKISDLAKIRNCIVHTSGRVELSRDNKYIKELVRRKPDYFGLSKHKSPDERKLIVEHAYCMSAVGDALEFFQEVFGMSDVLQKE